MSLTDRSLDVLAAFTPDHPTRTLQEISRESGLPLTTTHRIVSDLVAWGALERTRSGRIQVGLRLWQVASLAPRGLGLREVALPYMEDLFVATGENVQLAVREQCETVFVERLTGRRSVTVLTRVGDRFALHATGVGLVLLAHAPDRDPGRGPLPAAAHLDRTHHQRPRPACAGCWPTFAPHRRRGQRPAGDPGRHLGRRSGARRERRRGRRPVGGRAARHRLAGRAGTGAPGREPRHLAGAGRAHAGLPAAGNGVVAVTLRPACCGSAAAPTGDETMTILQPARIHDAVAGAGVDNRVTAKLFPYPLNAWYVAAWDHEITRTILARTIAGRPLALYRTEDGRPVALADACWHRLAPLSLGKLVGPDEIQCPYHGIRYDSAGRCTSMPAQETINPSATVPSFPLVERYRYVWIWLGDPALANPAASRTCTR